MKGSEFEDLVLALTEERLEISRRKRHDYACDGDALTNFKEMAALARILRLDVTTPFGVAVFHELHKLYRKWNLYRSGKDAQNESLRDTVLDQHNYIDLGIALLEEANECA